jgi:hypothetical protein
MSVRRTRPRLERVAEKPEQQPLSPVERHVERAFVDVEASGYGKPLSRRVRQTRRSVEAYLRAGGLPRYMERLREIHQGMQAQRMRLERAYEALLEECGADPVLFAERWRERAAAWPFEKLNTLIREHNEWYPIEANLPMDPRTRDYVLIRGRSYRKRELGPDWILEQFPAAPRAQKSRRPSSRSATSGRVSS